MKTQEQTDRDYGIAVVAKQQGVSVEEATVVFDGLSKEAAETLVDAGRNGEVEVCRDVLAGVQASSLWPQA